MNCHVCFTQVSFGDIVEAHGPATHICSELDRPVCDYHARYCVEDGHTATPIE